MRIDLVDGTYELFRHHHALPDAVAARPGRAVRGVMSSVLRLLEEGATHVGVATDEVIESFRNELWPGYKTGEGLPEALAASLPLLGRALRELGVTVWAMVEVEADDALATAAVRAAADPRVARVLIRTPDKDLAQCVDGERVVLVDPRTGAARGAAEVRDRFGVPPDGVPDYLALVGDAADGFPGLPGWGPRSAAAVIARWGRIEAIPADPAGWDVSVRGAPRLARALEEGRERALLFRRLATLRTDVPGVLERGVDALEWRGPGPGLERLCRDLGAPEIARRAAARA